MRNEIRKTTVAQFFPHVDFTVVNVISPRLCQWKSTLPCVCWRERQNICRCQGAANCKFGNLTTRFGRIRLASFVTRYVRIQCKFLRVIQIRLPPIVIASWKLRVRIPDFSPSRDAIFRDLVFNIDNYNIEMCVCVCVCQLSNLFTKLSREMRVLSDFRNFADYRQVR